MNKVLTLETEIRLDDPKAFEQVFNLYYEALVIYGRSILRDQDEAEDIVQQVFVNTWEKRDETEIHTSVRALLYKSVHNACLNRIKHEKIKRNHADHELYVNTMVSQTDHLSHKELQLKVEDAINALPEQCAKIFRMSRFEELKYKEIAEQLGLSVKTIENQMGKALKILRIKLQDYLPLFILLLTELFRD